MGVLVRLQSRAPSVVRPEHVVSLPARYLFFAAALLATLAVVPHATAQSQVWPGETWEKASPEEVNLDMAPLDSLHHVIEKGYYGNVDRMVVVKDGFLVACKRYINNYEEISRGFEGVLGCGFETCVEGGEDDPFNYYHPSSHPYYQGRDVHSLQSVTKSVAATVMGAALANGDLPDLSAPLLPFFGAYNTDDVDERLHSATLEHLLTMQTGIEWHETDRPIDETNTTTQLEKSEDWTQFVFDQPMDAAPGEKWVYNSGGSHLMSGVILDATGMTIDMYAEEHLFGPLQIPDYHWKRTPRDLPDTEGGLYLEAEQLAKIALLYLRDGMWKDRRILEPEFVSAAVDKLVPDVNPYGWGYGYQWWRLDQGDVEIWAGLGFGEQYLLVLPDYNLIGVINSWNIFGPSEKSILQDFIRALISAATIS